MMNGRNFLNKFVKAVLW